MLVDPGQPNPKKSLFVLEPVADRVNVFRVAKGPEVQLVGEKAIFEFDPEGVNVRSLKLSSAQFERVNESRSGRARE